MTQTRQQQIVKYLEQYQGKRGYMPNRREIALHFRTSTSVINYYLDQMRQDGIIEVDWGIARGIRIVKQAEA